MYYCCLKSRYLVMLPVVLLEKWGWLSPVITATVSWALLGIEAAACEVTLLYYCCVLLYYSRLYY